MNLYYVPMDEIEKILFVEYTPTEYMQVVEEGRGLNYHVPIYGNREKDRDNHLKNMANIHRINSLYMIQQAGGGHIGTCFSSAEIVTLLHHEILREGDIFFSSKGHDAPLFYSALIAKGIIPFDEIHNLRRPGGLPGHPDIRTPGISTNTGSLGMGISKAKGMILARRLKNETGNVFVLMGDGELQEGQVWESLAGAVREKMHELVVIVDMNHIQSDLPVIKTAWMGKYAEKFKAFGWHTDFCQGHEIDQLREKINEAIEYKDGPSVIFAETVKGKGVSFMEGMRDDEFYQYHSGALERIEYSCYETVKNIYTREVFYPGPEDEYEKAIKELRGNLKLIKIETLEDFRFQNKGKYHKELMNSYLEELMQCTCNSGAQTIILNADLLTDHHLQSFKTWKTPFFFEFGIAEQDMVSAAGGLALEGFIPICHSFACFLTRRANEQIYNNCTEGTHIIYVGTLAGVLPNEIGHSHEALYDVELMRTMPGMEILTPYTGEEVRDAIRWAVFNTVKPVYIRIPVMPDIERMRNG